MRRTDTDLPSLRWGERIETVSFGVYPVHHKNLPSLRWGERIETYPGVVVYDFFVHISPHFGGGSGLKL